MTSRLFHRLWVAGRALARRLGADSAGNVLIIAAGAMFIMTFALGFGIDYSRAEKMQTRLNAAADAAVLMAVDPAMIGRSDAEAQDAATKMFVGQTSGLQQVTISPPVITTPTTSSGALAGTRTATVSYTATVPNIFASILGKPTLTIGGRSQAIASLPPSINFYVVLDTSPSMLLPTSDAGITAMRNATTSSTWSKGCAFACHTMHIENLPMYTLDTSGRRILVNQGYYGTGSAAKDWYRYDTSSKIVYDETGTKIGTAGVVSTTANTLVYKDLSNKTVTVNTYYADSFWLAQNYGLIYGSPASIELRVDAETDAARKLISFAQDMEDTYTTSSHPVSYKMQFYTFSYSTPQQLTLSMVDVNSLTDTTIPDLSDQQDLLYSFYYWTSSSIVTNDKDTDFTTMFNSMNTTMANPGSGATTSTPQGVMVIVTDGLADQAVSGQSCQSASSRGCVELQASHLTQCTTIKNRGIRIAILYTEYLASSIQNSGLSFADGIATTNLPQIEPKLKSCASTNSDGTLLYQKVSSNQDISTALNTLFAMSLKTARLSQ